MRRPYQNELMHSYREPYPNELMHYGVLGMRWGFHFGHPTGGKTASEFLKDVGKAAQSIVNDISGKGNGSGGRGASTGGGGMSKEDQNNLKVLKAKRDNLDKEYKKLTDAVNTVNKQVESGRLTKAEASHALDILFKNIEHNKAERRELDSKISEIEKR